MSESDLVPVAEDSSKVPVAPVDEVGEDEELPHTIPVAVSRSLRSSLGDESAHRIEAVFYDALESDSDRIRLDAAKTLGQFAIALQTKDAGGALVPRPKTAEDVQELTLDELLIWMAALYLDRLKKSVEDHGREEGIARFLDGYDQDGVLREMVKRLPLRPQALSDLG